MRRAAVVMRGLVAGAAMAGAAGAQNLTIGTGGSITSLDPHFFNAAPNNALANHVFDRLVDRDARSRLTPGLAESWRALDDLTWEFRLREGVTWHDGRPFTADDVVFTLGRAPSVPNSPSGFGSMLRMVAGVEIIDARTLRVRTSRPNPLMPNDLAGIFIVSRHAGEGATTDDYNSTRAAIGTGPYRIASHRAGDRTELVRHEGYWGGREPWQRVSYRFIANDSGRTAAILAGDVDMIDQVAPTDVPRLRREARVVVSEIPSLRLVHIGPTFAPAPTAPLPTDVNGQPLPRNPLLDTRVRRALDIAINRQAVVERVMDGLAAPAGQWLPAGIGGHDSDTPPRPFDPEGARRLLAEAGYPQGFRLTLHTPNDRFPNDSRIAQAVAQMWTRIGVRTEVDALPWTSFSARGARQEFAISLTSWGSTSGEGLSFPTNILATYNVAARTGPANSRRYSNAELDAMIEAAAVTMDEAARERAVHGLVRFVAREAPAFPIMHLQNVWAHRRGLRHDPRMDERTLAMGIRAD